MGEITNYSEPEDTNEFQEYLTDSDWKYDNNRECWKLTLADNTVIEIVEVHGRYQPLVPGLDGLTDYNIGVFNTCDEAKRAAWIRYKEVLQALYERTEAMQDFH